MNKNEEEIMIKIKKGHHPFHHEKEIITQNQFYISVSNYVPALDCSTEMFREIQGNRLESQLKIMTWKGIKNDPESFK